MLIFLLVFSCLSHLAVEGNHRVIRQLGSTSCVNPNRENGNCVLLSSCPSLTNMIRTSGRDPQVANFLKQSHCGFQNGSPKVCCPRSNSGMSSGLTNPSLGSTTRPPSSTNSSSGTRRPTPANNPSISNYGECGKTNKTITKIVGGKNADLGDWPWMVALGYRTATKPGPVFQCGATLISNKWVVTAAHCVQNLPMGQQLTMARIGDLDLNDDTRDGASPIDAAISEVIVHPQYSRSPIINDIALLRLRDTVQFTQYIRPLCIMSGPEYLPDSYYTIKRPFIIGWGRIEQNGPSKTRLQETSIDVINNTFCGQAYSQQRSAKIDSTVICAGEPGKDTCQGDSGGPLIIPVVGAGKNSFHLAGIVSYGVGCADSRYPGVYTRVAVFADWISQVTGLNL